MVIEWNKLSNTEEKAKGQASGKHSETIRRFQWPASHAQVFFCFQHLPPRSSNQPHLIPQNQSNIQGAVFHWRALLFPLLRAAFASLEAVKEPSGWRQRKHLLRSNKLGLVSSKCSGTVWKPAPTNSGRRNKAPLEIKKLVGNVRVSFEGAHFRLA